MSLIYSRGGQKSKRISNIDFPCKTTKNNRKTMKNVTRSKMAAVHTNDDIYTDTLGRKRKSVVRRILFYFSRFLEKVHIACINRHKIGNIHDAHVARISNLLNKEITVETFYFGKKNKRRELR